MHPERLFYKGTKSNLKDMLTAMDKHCTTQQGVSQMPFITIVNVQNKLSILCMLLFGLLEPVKKVASTMTISPLQTLTIVIE